MRIRWFGVALLSFITGLSLLMGMSIAADQQVILSYGARSSDDSYKSAIGTDLRQCQDLCTGDKKCAAFTHDGNKKTCFLQDKVDVLLSVPNQVSGQVGEVNSPSSADELRPFPEFIVPELAQASEIFRLSFRKNLQPGSDDVTLKRADLQTAIGLLDNVRALEAARAVIVAGGDQYYDWRALALIMANKARDTYPLRGDALSAGLIAYKKADTDRDRAEALGIIADDLMILDDYKMGLKALKLAVSLHETPALKALFLLNQDKYGFRVSGSEIDSNSAQARFCIQFSDVLKEKYVDYAGFIRLDGKEAPAVIKENRQICLDRVERGSRHEVTVRAGVPSEDGEKTLKPITLQVYVKDREPAVYFNSTEAYLLPKFSARQSVPITSVNISKIALTLYYIPQEALPNFTNERRVSTQLSKYDAYEVAKKSGEKIWEGVLDAEIKINEEVTTALPLTDILKEQKAGLYIVQASPKLLSATLENSEEDSEENSEESASQWVIVSDLGLTSLLNETGLTIFVRSLQTAKPITDADIALYSVNNGLLGKAVSNNQGYVQLPGKLLKGIGGGAPALISVTSRDGDYAFLSLTTPSYDFSDRGVAGRLSPGPVDVMVFPERGIYRGGETVHVTALARDDKANAVENIPLSFVIKRPDGVESQRTTVQAQGSGGYSLDLPLLSAAMTGRWAIEAYIDVSHGASVGTGSFLVEDFTPQRVDFDLKADVNFFRASQKNVVTLAARFLYGVPASFLNIEGWIGYSAVRELAEFPGYRFGLEEKFEASGRQILRDFPQTDAQGQALLELTPSEIPETSQPIEAKLVVTLSEGGSGKTVNRSLSLPLALDKIILGIKPLFRELDEGETARFELMAINSERHQTEIVSPLNWELLQIRDDFQWFQRNGRWQHESTEFTTRLSSGTVETSQELIKKLEAQTKWGKHRLVVKSQSPFGPSASLDFTVGWYQAKALSDTPDILQIALDKELYKIGDQVKLKITPRSAGLAQISVVGESLISTQIVDVGIKGTEVSLPMTAAWTPGTYIVANLYKPDGEGNSHMPSRAIGVVYPKHDETNRTIDMTLDVGSKLSPRQKMSIPVQLSNIPQGEQAYVTIALVDVGILNITTHKAPNPLEWFYGQRRLATNFRDLYGRLIDGSLGVLGKIRSGGGGSDEGDVGDFPAKPIRQSLAFYSGIVTIDAEGRAVVQFDIPEFNGTARIMAVAWSQSALGSAQKDVVIADPVVLLESFPPIMTPGDQSRIFLDINNIEGPEGAYRLELSASPNMHIENSERTINLKKGERTALSFPLEASAVGESKISFSLKHDSGLELSQSASLMVRPAQPFMTQRQNISLKAGESLIFGRDRLQGQVPGTGEISVSINQWGSIDVPGLLLGLDRYPYGCTEQIVSRALPLLYLNEVAGAIGFGNDADIKKRVEDAIANISLHQSSGGSFRMWGGMQSLTDLWTDAYATDFLTRAQQLGFAVSQRTFDSALTNLQNGTAYADSSLDDRSPAVAYALYVLARNKQASLSNLRYYSDSKLDSFSTPLAKAQLAASLTFYGDNERAALVFAEAYKHLTVEKNLNDNKRSDYGSFLRDSAGLLTLLAEAKISAPFVEDLKNLIVENQKQVHETSTQESAWMLLAAHALLKGTSPVKIALDARDIEFPFVHKFRSQDFDDGSKKITNNSSQPIDILISTSGVPIKPLSAGGNGFKITRSLYYFDGTPVNIANIKQNDRLVIILRVNKENNWPTQLMLVDLLPAGFEIENPNLINGTGIGGLGSLLPKDLPEKTHLEFRADRFVLSTQLRQNDGNELVVGYTVRAVSPGRYTAPPAYVEDSYRPYFRAQTEAGSIEIK